MQLQEEGLTAWETPAIMPVEQWCADRWQRGVTRGQFAPREVIDVPRQRRLWRQIIEEHQQGFSLLGSAKAAQRCQQARAQLLMWQIDWTSSAAQQEFSFAEDSAMFMHWLGIFEQRLGEGQLLSPEDATRELMSAPELLADQRLLLLDTDDLPPLQSAVFALASDVQYLDSGDTEIHKQPVRAFPDERSELRTISRWCLERFESDPSGRFAVVLQDMQASREQLEVFLRRDFGRLTTRYETLPVNFATGLTLVRVPLVRDALRALALADREVAVEDIVALLHSRFVTSGGLDPASMGRCVETLYGLQTSKLSARVWHEVMDASAADGSVTAWDDVARLARNGRWQQRPRPPSQWIEPFCAVLTAWGWPFGLALDSLEHQQLDQWQLSLDALARFDAICGDLRYTEALDLLREQCAQALFQPRTDDACIQVLGPLETTGLAFDDLWLAGMSAEQWPAAPRPNPYLPRSLQRRLRMPHADIDWERARTDSRFRRWQLSARYLHSSFVAQRDEAAVAVSPLLRDLPAVEALAVQLADSRWEEQTQSIALQEITLTPQPLREVEPAWAHVGTAALQDMSLCPFRAFAARRLKADPGPDPTVGLTPGERGSLLHDALYRLFGLVGDQGSVRGLTDAERDVCVERSVESLGESLDPLRREIASASALDMEKRRITDLLKDWLDVEAHRTEAFRVVSREAPHTLALGQLNLKLRVDRVDELGDGSRLIIDYKSGRADTPVRWFDDPPSRPQLPIYALLEPPAHGVAYAILRGGELGFKGVAERAYAAGISDDLPRVSKREELSDMQAAREFWRTGLEALATDFVDGTATVEPTTDACRYCARFALCRLAEVDQ